MDKKMRPCVQGIPFGQSRTGSACPARREATSFRSSCASRLGRWTPISIVVVFAFSVPIASVAQNLIVNGDAETGNMSGWADLTGIGVVSSSVTGTLGLSECEQLGAFCFTGGSGPTTQTASQVVDLTSFAAMIDSQDALFVFDGLVQSRRGGTGGPLDAATVLLSFRDHVGAPLLEQSFTDPTTAVGVYDWYRFSASALVPVGTRDARITLSMTRVSGDSTDAFVDNLSLEIVAVPSCSGDVDGNGLVDLADLSALLSHFGTVCGATTADGDVDADADVDLGDLALLLANFGTLCP